jgi:hypothetical protein
MREFFKRDNIWLGIVMALVLPVIFYFLIKLISGFFSTNPLTESTIQLLALAINLLPFRYYLIRLKADKTGRGILLVTFVLALVYFYFNWSA